MNKKDLKNLPSGGAIVNEQGVTNDGSKGGVFVGKRHMEGGIKVSIEGGGRAEIEDFEPIIAPNSVNSNKKYTYKGKLKSAKEILSEINTEAGGVPIKKKGGELSTNSIKTHSQNEIKVKPSSVIITRNAFLDDTKKEFDGKKLTNKQILSKINEDGGGVRFDDIEIKEKGGNLNTETLLAPNGKPSNLKREQWHLVRSKNFIDWFGDFLEAYKTKDYSNVSKVLDENGEPLVVYHGTQRQFYIFEPNKNIQKGIFFTNDYDYANWRSEFSDYANKGDKKIILSCFLSLKEPEIKDKVNVFNYEIEAEPHDSPFIESSWIEDAKKNKYDGMIIKAKLYNNYIAFYPNQIKLADGTNTTFDTNNPDIRFEDGGKIKDYKTIASFEDFTVKIYDGKLGYEDLLRETGEMPKNIEHIEIVDNDTDFGDFDVYSKKQVAKMFGSEFEEGFPIVEFHRNKEQREILNAVGILKNGEQVYFDKEKLEWCIGYEKGGNLDDQEETYKKWKSLVNMSKSELENFYNSTDGKEAGLSSSEAAELGIHSGRESARWIMKMKDTPKDEWTPTMWDWAKRQISFISRMKGNKGGLYDDKGNKTRKHTSLLIWGHNPEKFEGGGEINNEQMQEFELLKQQAQQQLKGFETEKTEHETTLENLEQNKINVDEAIGEIVESHLEENPNYYSEQGCSICDTKKTYQDGGELDAKKKAEEYWNSLSEEDKAKILGDFGNAVNDLKDRYKQDVIDLETKKSELVNRRKEIYEQEKAINVNSTSAVNSMDLFRERQGINEQVRNLDLLIQHAKNVEKAFSNGGTVVQFQDKKGNLNNNIPSFLKVDTSVISFNEETILADEMPKYIPFINESVFKTKGFVFDAIRIDRDTYIVATNGYQEVKKKYVSGLGEVADVNPPTSEEQGYVLVTLDQLVLINDYYITKQKAIYQKEADEKNQRNESYYDKLPLEQREKLLNQKNYYTTLPVAVKKKVTQAEYEALDLAGKEALYKPFKRYNPERLKSKLEENYMWSSFHKMYERFLDPTATNPRQGIAHPLAFDYWRKFRDMMSFKIKDIKMQREVDNEQYKKALETSFGDINTNDILFADYGILVKRQDGKAIEPTQVNQIQQSWVKVQKCFGNLKVLAKEQGLKISHTNTTNVFASKAIGVFVPSMKTIAVSAKYGNEQFDNTFAHEVAHFIDSYLGGINGKRWATDDYESTAGTLAFEFRRLLNKKSDSDYINATKECFARALQQYFAISTFGDEAQLNFSESPLDKLTYYFLLDNFVSKDSYYNIIKPMVEKFLSETGFEIFVEETKNEVESLYPISETIVETAPIVNKLEQEASEKLNELSKEKPYNFSEILQQYQSVKNIKDAIKLATNVDYWNDDKMQEYSEMFSKDLLLDIPSKIFGEKNKLPQNLLPIGEQSIETKEYDVKKESSETINDKIDLLEPLVAEDDLRPHLQCVFKDKKNDKLVATDAHVMAILNQKNIDKEELIDPKTKDIVDSRFPDYSVLIPYNNPNKISVDVQEIYNIAKQLDRANRFFKTSYGEEVELCLRYLINDENYYVAANTTIKIFKLLLQLGYKKAVMEFSTPTRAITISNDSGLFLIMPIIVRGWGQDLDTGNMRFVTVFNGKNLEDILPLPELPKLITRQDFEIRKSIGGWSVDKKEQGIWNFIAKFPTKKEAESYVETQINKKQKDLPTMNDYEKRLSNFIILENANSPEYIKAIKFAKENGYYLKDDISYNGFIKIEKLLKGGEDKIGIKIYDGIKKKDSPDISVYTKEPVFGNIMDKTKYRFTETQYHKKWDDDWRNIQNLDEALSYALKLEKNILKNNETEQTNEVLQPTKGESITTAKASEDKQSTEKGEYLTNEKEIIDAVVELASKSKSDVAFIKNITTIGSNFGLDITSNEFINALGLKKGDVEYNKRKLKNIYLTQGLNLKKQIKEKQKELKAEAFLSNIENMAKNANDEMENEIKKKDSKSEILEAIEALEILAEMGNQEAVEAIDALKILLD